MTAVCTMLVLVEHWLGCGLPPLPADPLTPLSAGQVQYVLGAAGWPEALWPEAAAVAWCESRWVPAADGGGSNLGLFQVNWRYALSDSPPYGWGDWARDERGFDGVWNDAVDNATVAWLIWDRNQGWAHNWPYCGLEKNDGSGNS